MKSLGNPNKLKEFDIEKVEELCPAIRNKIIETVSKNGGHLASNLGAVELTLALYRAFDFPRDKLVWMLVTNVTRTN